MIEAMGIGASVFSSEVLDAVGVATKLRCNAADCNPSGESLSRLHGRNHGWRGTLDQWLADSNTHEHVAGISPPQVRKAIIDKIVDQKRPLEALVHAATISSSDLTAGRGSIICSDCVFITDIVSGSHEFINFTATAAHSACIGDLVYVNPQGEISGEVTLADETFVSVQATILQERLVEYGATVGAGAYVVRDILTETTVKGISAC